MAWRRSSVRARQGPPSKYLVLDTIRIEDFLYQNYCLMIQQIGIIERNGSNKTGYREVING